MSTIDTIRNIIQDLVAGGILREKIVLLEKEINALVDRNAHLEKKVADLVRENEKLKNELSNLRMLDEEFMEYKGAYFKRLPGGNSYTESVYCFHCQSPMWSMDIFPYECSKCGHQADFSKDDLPKIMEELKNL